MGLITKNAPKALFDALQPPKQFVSSQYGQHRYADEMTKVLVPLILGEGAPIEPTPAISKVPTIYCDTDSGDLYSYTPEGWKLIQSTGSLTIFGDGDPHMVAAVGTHYVDLSHQIIWVRTPSNNWMKISGGGTTINQGGGGPANSLEEQYLALGDIPAGCGVYLTAGGRISRGNYAVAAQCNIIGVAKDFIPDGTMGIVIPIGIAMGVLSSATPGTKLFLGPSGMPITYGSIPINYRMIQLGFACSSVDMTVRVFDYGIK